MRKYFYMICMASRMLFSENEIALDEKIDDIIAVFQEDEEFPSDDLSMQHSQKHVHKFVLENGLTVLVVPVKHATQVATYMWYNVGSKQESIGERGMAHFIEHMIFKGTQEMLSESDIPAVASKLSAMINAATWFDFTEYFFITPLANWDKVLPIFADCMQHCRFRQDHMDSEVKAVIQELKMYNDKHERILPELMASTIFDSHPYHYSVIGFKQDLWNLKRETLINFYKKYYVPNNAAFIVVGNVEPQDVLKKAKDAFGVIPRGEQISQQNLYFNDDVCAKSITLYRDITQSIGALGFVVPGAKENNEEMYDILAMILAKGKGSRLYKKLVDQESLVLDITAQTLGTYDKEIFYILFEPKKESDFEKIKSIILSEIDDLVKNGISQRELVRATKLVQKGKQKQFEDVNLLGFEVGYAFWATGNEENAFVDWFARKEEVKEYLTKILKENFKRSLCHEGKVFSIMPQEKDFYEQFINNIAQQDGSVLAEKQREDEKELLKYADKVSVNPMGKCCFQKPEIYTLDNGLTVVLAHSDAVDVVDCLMQLKVDDLYDPAGKEGICSLVADMMLEGSKNYPGRSFVDEMNFYGISMATAPGRVVSSMLSGDVDKGLMFLKEALSDACFETKDFNAVKELKIAQVKASFDDAKVEMLIKAKQLVYKDHLYARQSEGTEESLRSITRDECYNFYSTMISPQGAYLIVVGNFDKATIKDQINNTFKSWNGILIDDIVHEKILGHESFEIFIPKNRDQVCLAYVGLSLPRMHPDYPALGLFDQIFLRGMDSILFKVRERTGLFYTYIGSSFLLGSDKEPGMIYITTNVAKDRVLEAKEVILNTLLSALDNITDEDFERGKEALVNTIAKKYETNNSRAAVFAFLQRYNLPSDYLEKEIEVIRNLKKEDMARVVKGLIGAEKFSFITIGNSITLDNNEW